MSSRLNAGVGSPSVPTLRPESPERGAVISIQLIQHVRAYNLDAFAVEMVSLNGLYTEIEGEVMDWLEAGTQMVVMINPRKRSVTVYRSRTDITLLTEHDTLDGADAVLGWRIVVRELFE
jgi:Uma2 family endonuclease